MPPSRPKISVITPSLNQGRFLEHAIVSVLDQNYPNLEYMIIDGGSQDGSLPIIKKYADRLAYWCSEPDGGQSHAINKGLARASGDIVAYLCSDDQYLPGALAAIADAFARKPNSSWIAGACRFARPDGSEYTWYPQKAPEDRVRLITAPWGVPQTANFWRRELFVRFGAFREDLHFTMDTEFQIRVALGGELPVIYPQEIAHSVLHADCKSVKSRRLQLLEQSRFLDFFTIL